MRRKRMLVVTCAAIVIAVSVFAAGPVQAQDSRKAAEIILRIGDKNVSQIEAKALVVSAMESHEIRPEFQAAIIDALVVARKEMAIPTLYEIGKKQGFLTDYFIHMAADPRIPDPKFREYFILVRQNRNVVRNEAILRLLNYVARSWRPLLEQLPFVRDAEQLTQPDPELSQPSRPLPIARPVVPAALAELTQEASRAITSTPSSSRTADGY
jgi:hypothetical protein